jgi:hypothetical protein
LFLIPLIAGLLSPRVIYTSVQTGDSLEAPEPDATTGLLHSSEVPPSAGLSPVTAVAGNTSKYGTFSGARPTAPTSRPVAGTTTPSNDEEEKVKINVCVFVNPLIQFRMKNLKCHGVNLFDVFVGSLPTSGHQKVGNFRFLRSVSGLLDFIQSNTYQNIACPL